MAVHKRKPAAIAELATATGMLGALTIAGIQGSRETSYKYKRSATRKKLHKKTFKSVQKRRSADIKRLEAKGDYSSKRRATKISRNKKWSAANEKFERKSTNRQANTYFDWDRSK